MLRARLRPEFAWPYPRLDVDRWYTVRPPAQSEADPQWLWLAGDVHPESVFRDHVELLGESLDDTPAREVRLRPTYARHYRAVAAGVWVRARDVLAQLAPQPNPPIADRRAQRLPSEHFDFRDAPTEDGSEDCVNGPSSSP